MARELAQVYLNKEEKKEIKKRADKEGRSISQYMRFKALEKDFKKEKRK